MTRLSCTFLQVFLLNFVRSFSDFLPRRRRGGAQAKMSASRFMVFTMQSTFSS